jgi:hypothetical protein
LHLADKKDVSAYKEQYPGASQLFSLLSGKLISRRYVGDILSKKEKIYRHPRFNANIGGVQRVAL